MKRRKTMQAVKKEALPKRARYYHSQIDMESLLGGAEYSELSNSYVIFICDFDPFDGEKYRYTVYDHCVELNRQKIDDGRTIGGSCTGFGRVEKDHYGRAGSQHIKTLAEAFCKSKIYRSI